MKPPVTLYVTTSCPYCRMAESLLDRLKIPYEARDLTGDPDTRRRITAETGWRTVPMIFVGDKLVGGFTDLQALIKRGELDGLLAGAGFPRGAEPSSA